MLYMQSLFGQDSTFVTPDTSKLSGWLNAVASCQYMPEISSMGQSAPPPSSSVQEVGLTGDLARGYAVCEL